MQITLTLFRLVFTFSIPSLLTLALYVSIAYELDRVRKQSKSITTFKKNNKIIVKHKNVCYNPSAIMKPILIANIYFADYYQNYYASIGAFSLLVSIFGGAVTKRYLSPGSISLR